MVGPRLRPKSPQLVALLPYGYVPPLAITRSEQLGTWREQAIVLHQLGILAQAQGDYPTARRLAHKQRADQSLPRVKPKGDYSALACFAQVW